MKTLAVLAAVVLTFAMAADSAEGKRLGGARSSGMQRNQATQPATPPAQSGAPGSPATSGAPAQQAAAPAATAATAAPAAATARRSWAGPLTGLAAGLGLAALASYLGFGEALANIMLLALIGVAVLALIGFFVRRRASGAVPAAAGAGATGGAHRLGGTRLGAALGGMPTASAGSAAAIPADLDVDAFVRSAKAQFVALQSANDAGDLQRLRQYLTPPMFEVVREDLLSRGGAVQHTQVFGLDAQVIEVAQEADDHVVSVRFTGRVRGQAGEVPEDLDEVWHLTKPRNGGSGWVVAGIQQVPQSP